MPATDSDKDDWIAERMAFSRPTQARCAGFGVGIGMSLDISMSMASGYRRDPSTYLSR